MQFLFPKLTGCLQLGLLAETETHTLASATLTPEFPLHPGQCDAEALGQEAGQAEQPVSLPRWLGVLACCHVSSGDLLARSFGCLGSSGVRSALWRTLVNCASCHTSWCCFSCSTKTTAERCPHFSSWESASLFRARHVGGWEKWQTPFILCHNPLGH